MGVNSGGSGGASTWPWTGVNTSGGSGGASGGGVPSMLKSSSVGVILIFELVMPMH